MDWNHLFGPIADIGDSDKAIFGTKPIIPKAPDITDSTKTAISADTANLPDIENVASKYNTFNAAEIEKMLTNTVPDLKGIEGNVSKNLLGETSGDIPEDVRAQMLNSAAGHALSGGFGGSAMGRNLQARDLGLTSLQMFQQGMDSSSRWLSTAKSTLNAPLFDVSSMFLSPGQVYTSDQYKFQRNVMAAEVAAAPDPTVRGRFDTDMQMIGMAASMFGMKSNFQGPPNGQQNPQTPQPGNQSPPPQYAPPPQGNNPSQAPYQDPYESPDYGGSPGGEDMGGGMGGMGDEGLGAGMGGFM